MHIPLLLAHGEGLISYMFVALAAGIGALACLISAIFSFVTEPRGSRRLTRRFVIAFVVCVLLIFFAPLFIGLLHLP